MKVITWETLYYEDHGATLKHKCGKRIVTLSLLSFSLIFLYFFIWAFSLFYGLFLFGLLWPLFYLFLVRCLIPTYGGIIVSIILSSLGQCSNNDDHHTFIYLQLNSRTKIWLYMNASGGVPGCAMNQEWHVWKNYERWFWHKYDVNYMIMQSNMTMMKRVIINGTVESCMAIYLEMAMEMP